MFVEWPCPRSGGETAGEMARVQDDGHAQRVLVIPPLFDEANKLRAQLAAVMRRLGRAGVDSVLPDLPGWNESTAPLGEQSLAGWRAAMASAAAHFRTTHALAVRAGALLVPAGTHGWDYAPIGGRQILRGMIRARTIAAREAGREESSDAIAETGRREGVELAGWQLGPTLFSELEGAEYTPDPVRKTIAQSDICGNPLWLRAEPDADSDQADALVAIITHTLSSENPGSSENPE
ncbi:hypothetical protein MKP08_09925 [Erythrobacter sp. LQ02-29]|uniref:hypothetical protein n=1 Tax=Erythrobacter sp. LQ02-29 TaxID=2920384 RepID=UPI001F4D3FB5|nr:hypothetical protein [Erythrobacter sp. LQ02-29]MCP9223065.1 hypothetical protein [Erythrobacter sp. LQ02-29]